jgi:hypothetical protein
MHSGMFFWIGGALVGLLGLTLLAWALFVDRSRGRRRCPKCWYDMSQAQKSSDGGGGWRCPECGREIRKESRLFRTRRRWKWAFASLLVFAAAGYLAIQPKVREHGWASVTPATVLIFALEMDDPQWALDGITQRIEVDVSQLGYPVTGMNTLDANRLSPWQWRLIATKCIPILDAPCPAATRRSALRLLSRSEHFVTDDLAVEAIYEAYWRHALDADQDIHALSTISLGGDPTPQRGLERLQSILTHDNPKARQMAVAGMRLMLRHGHDLPVPTLIKALQDENRDVRVLAAGALSTLGRRNADTPETFKAITSLLSDPDANARRQAAYMLSSFGLQRHHAKSLIQELMQSEDESLRIGALDALASMEDRPPYAVQAVLDALRDESSGVRKAAMELLTLLTVDDLRPHREALETLAAQTGGDVRHAILLRIDDFERER